MSFPFLVSATNRRLRVVGRDPQVSCSAAAESSRARVSELMSHICTDSSSCGEKRRRANDTNDLSATAVERAPETLQRATVGDLMQEDDQELVLEADNPRQIREDGTRGRKRKRRDGEQPDDSSSTFTMDDDNTSVADVESLSQIRESAEILAFHRPLLTRMCFFKAKMTVVWRTFLGMAV